MDSETLATVALRLRHTLIGRPEVDEVNSGLAELSGEQWKALTAHFLTCLEQDGITVIDRAMQGS
jgi:hypothetical protein